MPISLNDQVAHTGMFLPSPVASDGAQGAIISPDDTYRITSTGMPRKVNRKGTDGSVVLSRLVQMWPTPRANKPEGYSSDGFRPTLAQCATGEQKPRHGQLNADFVECLMNFPIGWTSQDEPQEWPGWPAPLGIKMWPTPNHSDQYYAQVGENGGSTHDIGRNYLRAEVKITETGQYDYEPPRVTTGQKDRARRLKALGNAVVPAQIYPIFVTITEVDHAD